MTDLFDISDRINDGSKLECRICWYVYDPAQGDPDGQVPPGTPFRELPTEWRCPQCDGVRDQFLLVANDRTEAR